MVIPMQLWVIFMLPLKDAFGYAHNFCQKRGYDGCVRAQRIWFNQQTNDQHHTIKEYNDAENGAYQTLAHLKINFHIIYEMTILIIHNYNINPQTLVLHIAATLQTRLPRTSQLLAAQFLSATRDLCPARRPSQSRTPTWHRMLLVWRCNKHREWSRWNWLNFCAKTLENKLAFNLTKHCQWLLFWFEAGAPKEPGFGEVSEVEEIGNTVARLIE